MKKTDLSGPESKDDSDEWKMWSPEVFLTVFIPELRTPLIVIKGYTTILADENMKEKHPQALEIISKNIEIMMKLCDGIAEYRNELANRDHSGNLE